MAPRRSVAAAVAAGALVVGLTTSPASANGDVVAGGPEPRDLASQVRTDALLDHLAALQAVADANAGNRAAGTNGYDATVRYVERRLAAAGYETWRQTVPLTVEETVSSSVEYTIDRTTRVIRHMPMTASPGTGPDGVTGRVVSPSGRSTGCLPRDWREADVSGSIALVSRGSCTFDAKSRVAAAAGASALIVHNSTAGQLNGTLRTSDRHVPTVGVSMDSGRVLAGLPDGAEVTVVVDKVVEERETVNLFAETGSGRAEGVVVVVGAQLDSDPDSPGINDNATGSVAILETAVQLAEAEPLDRTVRFAWWGGGELDRAGSQHYVDDLAETDPEALEQIDVYLDVRQIGSTNGVVGVYDADESTYAMPGAAPSRAAQAERLIEDRFDATGQPWVDVPFSAPGDHRPFARAGVPAAGLTAGADGTKSPDQAAAFGGTAGLAYDPNQDTVADDADNVDPQTLSVLAQSVAHTTVALATDPGLVDVRDLLPTEPPAAGSDDAAPDSAETDGDD
ncbi:M28 family peptidase [Nostocoides sp. F2B08]|uniref:M28 family peptidase n=1 Tax=Nostocoides sp. F2B08 TaxID=2653936 RepID=UPI00186AD418|nr:M28 family peptidase [Tetrasphaera sp. F2B08]